MIRAGAVPGNRRLYMYVRMHWVTRIYFFLWDVVKCLKVTTNIFDNDPAQERSLYYILSSLK